MLLFWLVLSSGLIFSTGRNIADDLPPDVAADNAYLEDLAANAPLSNEERKVVALLERIENKIGSLNEEERAEFVKKVANYKDKFALVLNKVESIPGMYGLNVRLLREVLAIPSEEVEEIHIDIDEALEPEPRFESPSVFFDDNSRLMDNMIIAERKAAYSGAPEFALPFEVDEDHSEGVDDGDEDEEPKTIDDLYDAITMLSNLVLVQIIHAMNPADEEPLPALPVFTPPEFAHHPPPTYQPQFQMPSPRSYQTQPIPNRRLQRPKPMKPMKPRYQPQQPSPYDFEDLFANIPSHYDEVHLNLNYGNKKRKRRQAEQGGQQWTTQQQQQWANQQQQAQEQVTYDHWYQTVYMPYLNQYMAEMAEYERALAEYEMAVIQADVPTNPFGNPSLMNPYFSYSKKAYSQHLFDQGNQVDLQATYGADYNVYLKQICEASASNPKVDKDPCWKPAVAPAVDGTCGVWDLATTTCK